MGLFEDYEVPRTPPQKPRRKSWLPIVSTLLVMVLASRGMHRGLHGSVHAQTIETGQSSRGKGHVIFTAEPQSIVAAQPAMLQLHFRVDPGFHINSHTPKGETLIPTRLLVEDLSGASVSSVDFPKGTEFSFSFSPKQKLDVYTGDLLLTAHVKAKPGSYTLKGALFYQACDSAACYPPKSLAVEQPFTAK